MNFDPEYVHVRKNGEGNFRALLILNATCAQGQIVLRYLQKLKNEYFHDPKTKIMSFVNSAFIYKVTKQLKKYITDTIVSLINNDCDGKFSIQIDGTTNSTSKAQYSLVLRYCTSDLVIHDRTVKFRPLKGSTGKDIFAFIEEALNDIKLRITGLIGLCTDGASSNTGETKGLCTLLNKKSPFMVYVWCVCHRFHLCVKDSINQHDPLTVYHHKIFLSCID